MITGLNILPPSDSHPIYTNPGDTYFNTNEQKMYVYDGNEWVVLSSTTLPFDEDEYLMEQRGKKINKLLNKIKNYESN